jgi:hypothetical protein
MKKELIFCLLLFFSFQLVLASVTVGNHSLQTEYSYGDFVSGRINLTISGEPADSLVTSNLQGQNALLKDFIIANGVSNFCSTPGCSPKYVSSNPETTKDFSITSGNSVSVGVVLTGDIISTGNFGFTFNSDFSQSSQMPLAIDFLNGERWEFTNFSGQYSSTSLSTFDNTAQKYHRLASTSEYCNNISSPRTNSLFVQPQENQAKNFSIKLYASSTAKLAECFFYGNAGCALQISGALIPEGDYYVCMGKVNQDVNVLTENTSAIRNGVVKTGGIFTSSDENYLFTVRPESYSGNGAVNLTSFFEDFAGSATSYLTSFYNNKNCSDGCVLPMTFSGIPQGITLSNLELINTISGGDLIERNIHDLTSVPSTVNFAGSLEISRLGFNVTNENLVQLYIGGTKILDENITVLSGLIGDLYPREVPAGVPVTFSILSDSNISGVQYNWFFGDGTNLTTSTKTAQHTYQNISLQTITIEATKNNDSETKSFTINVSSPREMVEYLLNKKKRAIAGVEDSIGTRSFSTKLKQILGLSTIQTELTAIDGIFNNSSSDVELVPLATRLLDLNVPTNLSITKVIDLLDFGDSQIDLEVLSAVSGESINSSVSSAYKLAIRKWFADNMIVGLEKEEVVVQFEDGTLERTLEVHKLIIDSSSPEEAYLIINKPSSNVDVSSGTQKQNLGSSTYITLSAGEQKTITLTITNADNLAMFISPKPSKLVLEDIEVNEECNFDGVCGDGETSENCRDDCRPKNLLVYYIIGIVFLFGLSLIGVSIWYQRHKEEILFGDRRQLFNLLAFIKNTKERGMKKDEISKMLIEKGWVKERIDYALSKSLKVDKLSLSAFNNFIDKKVYNKNAITQNKQQQTPKINKPNSQGMNRKR